MKKREGGASFFLIFFISLQLSKENDLRGGVTGVLSIYK
jgi:hypothetical protein